MIWEFIKKLFNNKNGFDKTWANMATGILYRRLIEFLKAKYICKIVEKIKEIKTKEKRKILSQYENYLKKVLD